MEKTKRHRVPVSENCDSSSVTKFPCNGSCAGHTNISGNISWSPDYESKNGFLQVGPIMPDEVRPIIPDSEWTLKAKPVENGILVEYNGNIYVFENCNKFTEWINGLADFNGDNFDN